MSGIKDIATKYGEMINQMAKTRLEMALTVGQDVKALVSDRVQNEGEGSQGQKYPGYSTNPSMPYWLLNPANFNAPGKIQKFKDDQKAKAKKAREAKQKPTLPSYKDLRQAYGLPTDKRTLTFDGDMWRSIKVGVESHDEFKTVVIIAAGDPKNQIKINAHSKQLGGSILAMNESEKEYVHEANVERLKDIYGAND